MISRAVKGKILYSLSMFVMLFIVLAGISIQWLNESEGFRLADETVEQINFNTVDLLRTDNDFYAFDLTTQDFFANPSTPLLGRHDSLYWSTDRLINQVALVKDFNVDNHLVEVDTLLTTYNRLFDSLVTKLRLKGFKDYGLEGKFREFAHALEDRKLIPVTEILTLRRHEKDYLLRHDQQYAQKLNELSSVLKIRYTTSSEATLLLTNYTTSFNELVAMNNEIGLRTQSNLKGELNSCSEKLIMALKVLNAEAEELTLQNHRKTLTMFIIAAVSAVVFCSVLIYLTARAV